MAYGLWLDIKLIAYYGAHTAYTRQSTGNTGILPFPLNEGADHVMLVVVSSSSSSSSSSNGSNRSSQYLTELSGAEAVGGRDDPALVDQGAAALDHLH